MEVPIDDDSADGVAAILTDDPAMPGSKNAGDVPLDPETSGGNVPGSADDGTQEGGAMSGGESTGAAGDLAGMTEE